MLVHSADPQQLISSQRDTVDMQLLASGITLRLRGNCTTSGLEDVHHTDICIKIPHDKNKSLARKEYEENQEGFSIPDFNALRRKYPDRQKYKCLHDTLDEIEGKDIIEFFRIDVIRERNIIKIPNELVGLRDDQAFYGELLYDRVRYVIDNEESDDIFIINPHCELELEALRKPCPWNDVPGSENYICRNLSEDDVIRCIDWFKNLLMDEVAPGKFVETEHGKAERGFDALMHFASDIITEQKEALSFKGKLKSVFTRMASAITDRQRDVVVVLVKPDDLSQKEKPVVLRSPRPPSHD